VLPMKPSHAMKPNFIARETLPILRAVTKIEMMKVVTKVPINEATILPPIPFFAFLEFACFIPESFIHFFPKTPGEYQIKPKIKLATVAIKIFVINVNINI